MAQDRMERVRAVYEDWARGDFTTGGSIFAPDIALVVDEGIPDGGSYDRVEGVEEYMARFLEPWETLTITGESFTEAGDRVLVRVRQHGVGQLSSVPVELIYFQVWTFAGERAARLEVIMDEGRALEAAGIGR